MPCAFTAAVVGHMPEESENGSAGWETGSSCAGTALLWSCVMGKAGQGEAAEARVGGGLGGLEKVLAPLTAQAGVAIVDLVIQMSMASTPARRNITTPHAMLTLRARPLSWVKRSASAPLASPTDASAAKPMATKIAPRASS